MENKILSINRLYEYNSVVERIKERDEDWVIKFEKNKGV